MRPARIELGALSLLVALGVGAYLWGGHRLEMKRTVATEAARRRERQMEFLREDNRRLAAELTRLQADSATSAVVGAPETPAITPEAVRAEGMRALVELRKENRIFFAGVSGPVGNRGALIVGADGRLPPAFADLFKLTAAQFSALQETLNASWQRTAEVIAAHTTVRHGGDDTVVMEIRVAPELAIHREQLHAAFITALGPDGYATYDALRPGGFNRMFNELGGDYELLSGAITVTRDATRGTYTVVMQQKTESGQPGGTGSTATGRNLADVIQRLGPLAKLLPPDF